MSTYSDHILRLGSEHLADLKRKAAEFERQLWDAHESLEYEMEQSSFDPRTAGDGLQESFGWPPEGRELDAGNGTPPNGHARLPAPDGGASGSAPSPEERTADLSEYAVELDEASDARQMVQRLMRRAPTQLQDDVTVLALRRAAAG